MSYFIESIQLHYHIDKQNPVYLILWPLNPNRSCISHREYAIEHSKRELIFVNELMK